MVVVSPNVDFDESSITRSATTDQQSLDNLNQAFGSKGITHKEEPESSKIDKQPENQTDPTSKWESDDETEQQMATRGENVPNGIDPGVPLTPREPNTPAHRHCCSEVEHLVDSTGPPPINKRQRPRAVRGMAIGNGGCGNHCASVGVAEIEEKETERIRKYAYYEALLTAENTHPHNKPADVKEARGRPDWSNWKVAMREELDSLMRHGTYEQVKELPPGRKAAGFKWVFKLKLNPNNSITRYKARLVTKGYSQIPGQDFMETTSPVARLVSYCVILSLAAKLNLETHHLDIETAFLNGILEEEIYMRAPDSFGAGSKGVWKLVKSLYRLKQASHVWNKLLDNTLKGMGFDRCSKDTCIYLYRLKDTFIILAVHVDNMLIASKLKVKAH